MCSMATFPENNRYRKTRTKTKKPKFLSLRRELSVEYSSEMASTARQQLNLFPLHPENLLGEKEDEDGEEQENVDHHYLFEEEGGATTLTGLLGGISHPSSSSSSEEEMRGDRDSGSISASLSYAYGVARGERESATSLARTALRHRERDTSEEKWVDYSDVAPAPTPKPAPGLSLKLDYQEILNAWSNKSPLYIEGEAPQTVPDLQTPGWGEVGWTGGGTKVWQVPDEGSSAVDEDGHGNTTTTTTMGQRAARVMRYKEKRQSRLFSKRIRYEVRKLNAEKRPRMKGRFVKRKAEQ